MLLPREDIPEDFLVRHISCHFVFRVFAELRLECIALCCCSFFSPAASEDPHVVLLPREDIPEDFLAEHIRCCQYFCKLQADTISQNLQLYGKMKEAEKRRMARLQDLCVEHYIRVCAIEDIDDGDRIRPFGFKVPE